MVFSFSTTPKHLRFGSFQTLPSAARSGTSPASALYRPTVMSLCLTLSRIGADRAAFSCRLDLSFVLGLILFLDNFYFRRIPVSFKDILRLLIFIFSLSPQQLSLHRDNWSLKRIIPTERTCPHCLKAALVTPILNFCKSFFSPAPGDHFNSWTETSPPIRPLLS